MKSRLVALVRCPECRSTLHLDGRDVDDAAGPEVITGTLRCTGCARSYPVVDGIPRLLATVSADHDTERRWTASRFGYLWSRAGPRATDGGSAYHFEKLQTAVHLPSPGGLVLDAGCGEGIDLVNVARSPGVEVVGVELSDGGCATSYARTRRLDNVHVVQGDLRGLPFGDDVFDLVYAYGVVHHLSVPARALREIVRVARPAAPIAIYVYEDFATRGVVLRAGLRLVNALRPLTTTLSPRVLFAACRLASPLVYAIFTVPHLVLRRIPGLRAVAAALPFRHARGPFTLAGDLYDRFSAPVELRFGQESTGRLLSDAGLVDVRVGYERGWVAAGSKPAR
jgi:SAM-dependent methyltransferase